MKTIFVIFLLLFNSISFSQTGYRIKILANLNQHYFTQNISYSALWGYTDSNGREYAILGCYTGTSFVDITDSNNIHEIDFFPSPVPGIGGNLWREMKTYSHYAYVVSEAENSNIEIFDLQYLPDSVHYVSKFILPQHSSSHSVSQSGSFLYMNGCNPELSAGITIVDLTNPVIPVLRGIWNNLYVHDSRIINDTIWACNIGDGRVTIINATDKNNPVTVRSWVNNPAPNDPHNIALTNDRHYAFVTDESETPSPGKLKIWDVSDLNDITYIRSFNSYPFENAIVHNVEIKNNFAFLAYYTAGVKVLNISNPSDPVEIGWFDTYPDNNKTFYDGCWAVYCFNSGKIIASDQNYGLYVLRPDLTNPVPHILSANFSVSDNKFPKTDSLRIIDASAGIAANWQWSLTGPENKTSNLKNPGFKFNTIGQYNVKLKVINSFGSDSISKTNAFNIIPTKLNSFNIINPIGNPYYRIFTSPEDTGKILFNWSGTYQDTVIKYKLYFRRLLGSGEMYMPSSNNGRDTFSVVRISFLDSLAQQFGMSGDSTVISFRAKVYNETDSLSSANSTILILRRGTIGIQNTGELIPSEFKLYNNYPNPFNPSTIIKFDLPKTEFVSMKLYDISGKEISELINEKLEAGSFNFTFNAGHLSSGVYFVRFFTKEYYSTVKILLVK